MLQDTETTLRNFETLVFRITIINIHADERLKGRSNEGFMNEELIGLEI